MKISNNYSPSFGSIQVGLSKMNSKQMALSDRLYDTIKYSESYLPVENNDIDIYMLPSKSRNEIEIRFMDPISGNFIRNQNGSILKHKLGSGKSSKIEEICDQVINTYKYILDGAISLPKINMDNILKDKTDVARLNPNKNGDEIKDLVTDWIEVGYSKDEAEHAAIEQYKSLYHLDNKDGDF